MPSSYTAALRLELPATGELSGTWGDHVNTGITTLVEKSIAGYTSIAMSDADYTLSQANGAADESRYMTINMTGTLTANRNVVAPNVNKIYVFRNSTTGGFALTLKTSAGTGISVPNGKSVSVFFDGSNNTVDLTSYISGILLVNGALSTNSTLSAALGSVASPSHTFNGDTNTGMWSPGADLLAWSTAGSERARIDSSGNVGIGITPSTKLHVLATTPAATPTWLAADSIVSSQTTNNVMQLHAGATGGVVGYAFAVAGTRSIGSVAYDTTSNNMTLNTNSVERMRIDSAGNVGINVTPSYPLDVSIGGTTGVVVTERIRATGNGGAGRGLALLLSPPGSSNSVDAVQLIALQETAAATANNASFVIQVANTSAVLTERMRITPGGKVGIGNTPTFQLDVSAAAGDGIRSTANSVSTVLAESGGIGFIGTTTNHAVNFVTNSTARMQITAAGVIQDAAAFELGYKDIPQNVQAGTYTLVVGDRGKSIVASGDTTVPASVFLGGNAVTIYNNGAGSITVIQGASLTLRQAGTTNTGNRTLARFGIATVYFLSATVAIISGSGLT